MYQRFVASEAGVCRSLRTGRSTRRRARTNTRKFGIRFTDGACKRARANDVYKRQWVVRSHEREILTRRMEHRRRGMLCGMVTCTPPPRTGFVRRKMAVWSLGQHTLQTRTQSKTGGVIQEAPHGCGRYAIQKHKCELPEAKTSFFRRQGLAECPLPHFQFKRTTFRFQYG